MEATRKNMEIGCKARKDHMDYAPPDYVQHILSYTCGVNQADADQPASDLEGGLVPQRPLTVCWVSPKRGPNSREVLRTNTGWSPTGCFAQ